MSTEQQLNHKYGSRFFLLDNPIANKALSIICQKTCKQPSLGSLLVDCYRILINSAISKYISLEETHYETRMIDIHPKESRVKADLLTDQQKLIVSSLIRAGSIPSQFCFNHLTKYFNPDLVRQDFLVLNRSTDKDNKVLGADLWSVKIGGPINDSIVFLPDPMGATGSTILKTLEAYKQYGEPKNIIALHLIVTPEYLKKVIAETPDNVIIFALRVDRGFSSPEVLAAEPGEFWDQEAGLNKHSYIVPGAGGLGEVLNNSFV